MTPEKKGLFEEAYNLLVDHNCAGPCPCNDCKKAKEILEDSKKK